MLLCNIYRVEKIEQLYKLIVKISDHIFENKKKLDRWYIWYSDIDNNQILNGLSHGLSGIAYSLIRSWEITNIKNFMMLLCHQLSMKTQGKRTEIGLI